MCNFQMSSYEREQDRLNKLLLECFANDEQEEDFDDGDDEDDEEDVLETQESNSDTEQDISDIEIEEEVSVGPVFVGKDRTSKWSKHVPCSSRTRAENLITRLPGPKAAVKHLKSASDIWKHFFDSQMLGTIVKYTNQHIQKHSVNYSRERNTKETDLVELQALISLLYLAGVLKSGRLNVNELWNNDGTGVELFRLTMSKFRFMFLLQHLRFDDIDTRADRNRIDKLAPIRNIFDSFVEKCKTAYTPFQNVTIDEKLEAFRGRCSFRQYIPSKPNRYGLKVFALVDSRTYYSVNLEVYVGTQPDGSYACDNSASALVQRLVDPIRDSKRNVTCDNWFTTIPLISTLLNDYKLTYLGTIRKNRRELPLEFSNPTTRPLGSSMFAYNSCITLVSYIPKKKKNVLLVSSLHHDDKIDQETGKPEMIMDYNDTKGGVDTLDKMCAAYDCSRNTRRWPMVIFYSMLNIAGVNSMVLYNLQNVDKNMTRRQFLHLLSSELADNHLRFRATLICLPRTIKSRIKEILAINDAVVPTVNLPNTRGRCCLCDRKKNRPTRFTCIECGKFFCLEHLNSICLECHTG